MDIFPLLDLISAIILFIFYVAIVRIASKIKPPAEFFLLDSTCYKPPFQNQNELSTIPIPSELENIVYEMVDELLKKTGVKVEDIGILVCVFKGSSSVSLSSIIAKRFKLRANIASYDLNGKWSTDGLMGVTLAKHLLQANRDCYALVVITEELPESPQVSTDSLIYSPSSDYRPSGAAIILSNRTSDSPYSKFKLMNTHNSHVAVSTVVTSEDLELALTITDSATSESEKVVRSVVASIYSMWRPVNPRQGGNSSRPVHRRKVPTWYNVWHVTGAAMVAAAERNPKIPRKGIEDSRIINSWFGYQPISTLWYRLAYVETKGRKIKNGDWVSQVAMVSDGSDSKGSDLVWRAIGDVGLGKKQPLIFRTFGDLSHIFAYLVRR